MNEAQWQQQVIEAAHLFGWRHLHVRRSIGKGRKWTTATNLIGWPDLLCFGPKGFAAFELKVKPNTPTVEQLDILESLRMAGAQTLVAYPSDWPVVEAILRGRLAGTPAQRFAVVATRDDLPGVS